MTYSLTYDHQAIGGAVASRFMATVIQLLEPPDLLIV
ncbi:MAG: 2-oxo acid dehydrogenase subunit E2 [Dehalococcoidales bacterium]|nr:2-oxo acid dehydrogenase subunit E2 [Dehalococcoidales bacterium]